MNFENLDKEVNIKVIQKKQNKAQAQQKEKEIKKIYSFTLKQSTIKKLDEVAKRNNRSRSQMLEILLNKCL